MEKIPNQKNDNELLKPKVTEVSLENLDSFDFVAYQNVIEKKDKIQSLSYEVREKFEEELGKFIKEISDVYSEEELNKTILYHVMSNTGIDIPADVEQLDFEGDYSFESFLQEFMNKLEEINS
jgi:hypothetical protein